MSGVKSSLSRASQSEEEFLAYCLSTGLEPSVDRSCVQPLIFHSQDNLPYTFKRLSESGVLSAPVIDNFRQLEGFISLLDISLFVAERHWANSDNDWAKFMNVILCLQFFS